MGFGNARDNRSDADLSRRVRLNDGFGGIATEKGTNMGKLYGLLVKAPLQEQPVTDHCFGDCGRISMGGAIMTGAGPMMMCCHDDCPHLGEQTDEPIGNSAMTGEPIYLRALTPNTK